MITHKVSKTSGRESLKLFRRLAVAFVLFLIAQMGWGETYYWIGGGADNNWTTVENWSTTEGATPGTGTSYPGDGDEVHIYGDVEVTISSDISIGKLLIQSGTNHLTSDFTTKLSGGGSLNITDDGDAAINLTRCAGSVDDTADVLGTLEINLPVICAGEIQTHSGTTLLVDNGVTLSAAKVTHSAGSGNPISKIQIEGTLDIGTGILNLNGNNNNGATQLVVTGTVKAGIITFDKTVYNNTSSDGTTTKITEPIINNGTIQVSNSFTIPAFTSGVTTPYSGNGTIELNGTNATFTNNDDVNITITTLKGLKSSVVSGGGHTTIENATFYDDITLSGENTFQNFTAIGLGGKTLTVNAEQTFQTGGTVTLSGTGDSNLLTVTGNGSGKFTLGTTTLTGEYLSLDTDSSVVSASTGTAFAQNSETTGSGSTSWIVTSAGGHLWNGENGDWETAANWLPQSVPATTDEVIINSGTPKINSAVTVKSITVNGGGINLLSDSLSVEALTLAASTSVTAVASTTINITEGQEIDEKITGAGKLVLASGKNYTIPPSTTIGIDIENNGSLSSTGAVTFSGDFTNTGSATFNGGLSIAGDLEDTGSLTGAITFNGTGEQTFSPNNVIYSGITVDKSAGTLSVDNSLQVTTLTLTSGAVSIDGDLTLWDGTDYQNYDFSSVAGTLIFTGGSSASPRVLKAAAITNSSEISADYLKLQAQGSSDITLNSCENISNLTLETNGGNIAVNGITADSLSIASGAASVKMKDTITLSSTSQDFIIDYPLLLTGDTTFSIIKDIKVQDTDGSIKSDASAGKNLSLTANTIQLLNGNALGDSTTGALGTISINSNLTLGADTQFFSSQINFAGTGAKNLSGAYKLSAIGNVTDNGEWTWATGSTLLFNGTSDQTFNTNTNSTYKDIAVNKTTGNFIIDTSVLKADNLTITNCEEIHFTGVNEITTGANLSFTKPITADNNLTISNTSGNVSFTDTFTSSGNLNIPAVSVTFAGDVTAAAISTKETTINCSKIQSSGNQNYAGAVTLGADTELKSTGGSISFTSTVDGANTLKLTSSTGTSFSGNVGASTSLTSLEINGTSNINCASITTSGNQTYNGAVNLEAGGTTTITGANTGAHIDFKNTINGSNTFSVNATSATFENTVGATTALTSLEITGTANINCSSIKTSDLQTYNDEIILQQNSSFIGSLITINGSVSDNTTPPASSYELTVNGNASTSLGNSEAISIPVQIKGNLANTNTGTASFDNDIKVTVDVTDNGIWNSADGKNLIFNGTGAQIFTPVATTTYKSILIDKTAGSFTTATNALQVGSFADSAANASTITFATNTTIGSAVELHTSKDVSFTNTTNVLTTASPNVYHNITHEKGITNLSGTVTAANITLHKANLTDATTLIAHGDVEFKNIGTSSYANIYGSNDLTITIDTGKSVTFNGDVGKAGKPIPTALTINGNTNIKCTLIATNGTQSYNGNVNLYSNSTNSSVTLTTNTSSEIDFSGDISEDSSKQIKLTIDSPVFNSTATAGNSSSITVNELEFLQDASIHSANITAINLTVPTISGTGKTVTLAASVSELSFSGNVEFNPNITTAASSNFKASSGTMTFKADVNFADNTLAANDGTIILTAANKNPAGTAAILSGNNTFKTLTLQGSVTLSGTNTITDLNIQDSVTISAGNTIINLTANKTDGLGGKTITFGAGTEQTVSGVLTLKGSTNTDGNRLNLRSSSDSGSQWKIKCTGANSHDIEFVDVQDGWNTSETGTPTPEAYNLFAITSNDSGNNTNWNFPGMIYTWNGSTGDSWNTASNWTPSSIPGKGADVRIASVTSPASTLLLAAELDLTDSYKGTPYNGIITVNAGAVFDLAGNNLTVGKITNKGLLRLTGASTQTIQATMENNGSDSTVEYYGTGSANSNFAWDGDNGASTTGKQYTNLIISRAMSQNTDEANKLDVSGKTTIIAGSTNSVSLDNEHNIFGGHVTLGNQSTSISAGTVTLNGTGNAGVAIFLEENVLAQNLTLNSNVQGTNLSINSPLSLNAETVTTTGIQTYNNAVILGTANEHTLSGTEITFATNGTINGEAKLTLSGTSENVLNADVGGTNALTSLSVTGPIQINCAQIKTTGAQTYGDTVTLGKNGNITLTAKNSSDEYQTVQFNQNVSSATSITPNLILDANTNISCSSVTVTGTQTYNGNVQIDAAATIKASEIDFAKDISGSGKKLTIDSPIIKSTIASGVAEITLSELSVVQTSTSLETANNTNINLNVQNINGAGKTIVIDETLKNITLTPASVTVEPAIQTEPGSKLTASSGTTTFKADVTLANGTLDANGGTIILTGSGSTLSGNNTFKNLVAQNSLNINGSNTIENFTAGTSTTGLGGKTITFGANTTQEVTGKLTLRGTANTDRLNLRSSSPTTTSAAGTQWKIDCTGSNAHDIEFVDIQDSNNITSSYYLFALNSIDHGNNTKWNFPGMKYEWTGADSTDHTNWNNAANWKYLSIPGKGADIEIPAGCTNYPILEDALDLNETYNSTSYNGKITVAANAQFDLAGQNLTLGEIANNGLVRLFGTQTIAATMSNGTDSSVEYYDSDPAAILTSFVWDGDGNSEAGKKYYNLIINKNVTQATTTGEQLKVSGTTTISAGTGKTVTLNNSSNVFTDHVIIGNSASTPQVNAGIVILNGSGTSSSAIYLENNILADSLTLNSNVQGGELTITAPLTINTAVVTSTGNQTYKSPVTLSHDVNFTTASGKLIKFENTVSGSGAEKLTISTGNSQFDGNVNNLSSLTTDATVTLNADLSIGSITTQAVNINTPSITTSGLQTYNEAVTLGADTILTSTGSNIALNSTLNGAHTITFSVPDNAANTITVLGKVGETNSPSVTISQAGIVNFNETVKAVNFTINKAAVTTFDKAVDTNTFTDDTAHTGNIIFKAGADIASSTILHTTGNVILTGTLTLPSLIMNNLVIDGDTVVTTTGSQTYHGTINDSTAGAHSLTLNSGTSQISFEADIGQTKALKEVTVNGPATIACSNIYTSGRQSFAGDLILVEDVTLNTNDTANGNINFASKVDSKSGETHSVTIKIPTQRSVEFTGKVGETTAPSVTIDQAGDVSFSETVKAVNLTINKAAATIFDKAVDTNTFTDGTAHTGNIIFKAGADIATATHLYTTGDITLTGTLSLPSLEINNLITDGTAAIETTAATGTQTYHGTINGKTSRTDNLTLSSTSDIIFDSSIGQTRALKTFDLTGPAKLSSNIAVTADDVTFNTSLGSTTSAGRKLTIQDCNTLTNPTAASTVSNIDFIFTGAADRQTAFNPGASEYLNITTDTIELNLGSNAFNQSSTSDFKITSGTVKAGTGGLTAGNLKVSGGVFIQTGVATDQVNDISLDGGSITWDSTAQGGSLTINGVVTEASGLQINYNKKSVTFTHDNTISGIFWNLTIDSGRTITNGESIRVRKDFTIDGTYVHSNKPIIFGFDLDAPETDSTENGEIADNAFSNIGKAYINKGASYKQTAATNLIFKDLEITSGTFENPDTITSETEILTNIADGTISNAGTFEVTRTFTDNGTYTGEGMLKFTGTSAQTFAPGTSAYSNIENTSANPLNVSRDIKATNIEIKSGKATTFATTSQIDTLTISSASETTFTGATAITNFDDTGHTGNITFKNGGRISTATVIHTTGNVTLTSTLTLPSLQMNNLIVDGTANINTSGDQIYNESINGKTSLTDILNLDSDTGHINFNGNIGRTLPLQTLDVQGETTINCEAITTTGTQTYNDAITLGTTPAPETHTLTASGISFVSTIDGGAELTIRTADGSNFADDIGSVTVLAALTVEGPVTIDCDSITTSGNQHYKDALVFETSPMLTSIEANLTFDSTIDGENTIMLDVPNNPVNTITVAGKVGETNIPSVKIAQAGNASFAQTVKAADFTITKANNTTFAKAVNITNFKITQADTTTFDELVQITNFTDAANAGDITFKNGGTIATACQFKTSGTVTFGDAAADTMNIGSASPYENLTHTAGNTNITGILNAAQITLAQTAGGPMTITNSGLFKTVDGAALSYTTSFAQNGSGNSIIGGSFTGNGNASFATNVQLYGSSQADFGSADKNISIAKDLIVIRDASDDLTINSNVSVSQNLVLYKGPVLADGNITVGSDILVLGSAYSEKDNSTGITDEYSYYCLRPDTWSQPNYTETLLPDASARPVGFGYPSSASGTPDFTGTLSVSSGKTISAAKNFYANGTTLQTAGTTDQWILKLPDLTNAAKAFAEAYHSEISGCKVICSDNSTDGSKARLVCLECDDTATSSAPNTNVDFDDFEITAAWTERDNSIRVEFNRPVRYYNETVQTLKFHNADGNPVLNFIGLYSDPDCQNEIEYDTQLSYFYIKAAPRNNSQYGAWNTDATGRSSGAADDQSTDRSGIHHENIPALDFARALINGTTTQSFIFTDRWGKRLNNYSSRTPTAKAAYGSTADTDTTHNVADKTGPVLWKVRTGQELHTPYDSALGEVCEHSYDAHNFIEFLYSEKVDFDGSSDDSTLNDSPATAENVQVNDSLGAVIGDITKSDNLKLAGLGILEYGLLLTGKNGSTDKYVSALYRKGDNAEYSIRLSIAGYTDPSVILTDDNGYTYKKWIGYIEQASMPAGSVKHLVDSNNKNERVKDKEGNVQIKYADNSDGESVFDTIPLINSQDDGLYGEWDLSEPMFALYRQNAATLQWTQDAFATGYEAEAIGNNSGVGSTLDRIEFHLYDNTPQFDDAASPEWFTEVGWCKPGTIGEKPKDLYKSYSYAADIFGGARPFDTDARRTSGGIRYSTIYSSVAAFKYGIGTKLRDDLVNTAFDTSKIGIPGASSLIFTGTSLHRRSAGDSEGLYFALPLKNTSLDLKTSFTVKYDENSGFITDLAGNRLRSAKISTLDRTPPSIDMTVCPVGSDDLQIIFVKELCTESSKLNYIDDSGNPVEITEDFKTLITQCIDFIKIDSSGSPTVVSNLKIDNKTPAEIEIEENQNGSFFTKIKFKLNRKVTLEDVKNTFVRIIYTERYREYSVDLFTGHPNSRVTFIQDIKGNNIQMYTAHALSDFAVGVIDPLYAYDSAMTEEDGTIISDSLLHQNLTEDVDRDSWSVHDWNRDQKNYGTLPAKRPLAIVADTTDGTEENETAPDSFRLYLANNPDDDSISTQYNSDLEPLTPWRIWLPNEMTGVFTALSEKNNTNYSQVDGSLLSDDISNRLIFDIGQSITNLWVAGNQISFLFGLTNSDGSPVTIMHSPELDINNDKQYLPTSAKMPLFALRQTEPTDLLSLDLWSFRLKDVVNQRGGVTILNNVINSSQREKVVVKVNQPKQGNLTVLVMTLDGSIVDYLHRGSSEAGEHFYSWDGTNRRGHSVARGMYFIRVTGPGIDETRKVMVVKD